jgi:hypothetical protein
MAKRRTGGPKVRLGLPIIYLLLGKKYSILSENFKDASSLNLIIDFYTFCEYSLKMFWLTLLLKRR